MRKPKPKVVSESYRPTRTKGKHGMAITVKKHKTKASAEKHAKKQMGKGKVSVIGKQVPYLTFTAKGPTPPKRKTKSRKKARKRRG